MSPGDLGMELGVPQDRAEAVLAVAARLLEEIERAVVGGGCRHRNGVAVEPALALGRFRRQQAARLAVETDADVRAALWVVQLCGVSEDALKDVDREALRAEVPPTSPVWASAARMLPPGLVYSLMVDSEPGASYLDEMLTWHPDTELRLALLGNAVSDALEQHDRQRARALLAQLDGLGAAGPDVELLRSRYERIEGLAPGAAAPDFDVPALDSDGVRLRLKDFRGRFLLLHFWGTWCTSCVEELVDLRTAHQRYAGEGGLAVMSVSDDEPRHALDFLAEHRGEMPWNHAFAGSEGGNGDILDAYAVEVLPWLVLIGPDQTIITEGGPSLRGPDLLKTLADVLPERV